MGVKYLAYLSSIFSPAFLRGIAGNYHVDTLDVTLRTSDFMSAIVPSDTCNSILDKVFSFLSRNYRNEYIYKNLIANKILLGKHSTNTATIISEQRIGTSKADTIILNGTSTVYEIKTELDSLERLSGQLNSYLKAFDLIYVVSSAEQLPKITTRLPNKVGLIELSEKNTLRTIKDAESNAKNVDPAFIFDIFRKEEYLGIMKDFFSVDLSNIPNTKTHKAAKEIFITVAPEEAHSILAKTLKHREMYNTDVLDKLSSSMTFNMLTTKLSIHDKINVVKNINRPCLLGA